MYDLLWWPPHRFTHFKLFTGKLPFADVPTYSDIPVIIKVLDGEPPAHELPTQLQRYREVWSLFQRCWASNALNRPQMAEIVRKIPARDTPISMGKNGGFFESVVLDCATELS
jgi:hypothetical protein